MKYKVISADNHIMEPPGTYVDRVPASMKDKAPRVLPHPSGGEGWTYDGSTPKATFSLPQELNKGGQPWTSVRKGNYLGEDHLKDMAMDGVDAGVIYPMITRGVYEFEDRPLALACTRAYNDWLLDEFCSFDPNRLISMAVIPTDDGVDEMMAEAERTIKKGAKGFFLPYYPERPLYHRYYDPLWKLAAETGVVPSLHHMFGGKKPPAALRDPEADPSSLSAASTVKSYFSAIDPITDMIFTGVFDRHPKLKFVHAEQNIGWAGYWIQQMHHTLNRSRQKEGGTNWYPGVSTLDPGEYVGRNVFFTVLDDEAGFDLAKNDVRIADAAMYSTDYEHAISLWPKSPEFITRLTKGLDASTKHKLLAGNCVRVFNLPE